MELKEFERMSIEQKLNEIYRIHLPEKVTTYDKSISEKFMFSLKNNSDKEKRIAFTANDNLLAMYQEKIKADAIFSDNMDGFEVGLKINGFTVEKFKAKQATTPLEIIEATLVSSDKRSFNNCWEFYSKGRNDMFMNLGQYFSKYQQVEDRIDVAFEDRNPFYLIDIVWVFTIQAGEEADFTLRLGSQK